jgi:hypothetical protein
MRALASTATLVFALALGAIGAALPRVALATPGLDACTGVLHRQAGTATAITISAPGTWCLDQDLVECVDVIESFFAMIKVDADDVTIDCRGHRMSYAGSANTMYGIATLGGRQRVTVRNCHLHGFSTAIATGNMDGFLVEDNTVRDSRPDSMGMSTSIDGNGSGIIRRNRIHHAVIRAIYAKGGSQVLDNLVDGVAVSPSRSQIIVMELFAVDGAVVRGNVVRGLDALPAQSQHVVVQIDDFGSTSRRTVVADNVFVHDGSMGDIGVACYATNVLVSDNILSGFFSPRAFCTETGDNDISP